MMMIRRFEKKDQRQSRELILAGLGEHFGFIDESLNPNLDDIGLTYMNNHADFWVAEDDGQIVGTAGLLFEHPGEARIVRMSVASAWRRRGVAASLLQKIIEICKARGDRKLWAYTQPEWSSAVAFYQSAGFIEKGRDEIDIHLCLNMRN